LAPDIQIGQILNTDFQLKGINRSDNTLGNLFQEKDYLLIYNWGVWCGFCKMNRPFIDSLYYGGYKKFALISINCESNSSNNIKVEKYIDINKIHYPVYQSCEFLKSNGIYTYPQLTIIDKNFKVVDFITSNALSFSEYENFLKKNGLIE
jgi:hypothetical protein